LLRIWSNGREEKKGRKRGGRKRVDSLLVRKQEFFTGKEVSNQVNNVLFFPEGGGEEGKTTAI